LDLPKEKDEFFELYSSINSLLEDLQVNIKERESVKEALRVSEEKLRMILESSPDSIAVTDMGGHLIECNQATLDLHGFSTKEEVIGNNSFNLIAKQDQERAMKNTKKTLEKGIVKNLEYTLLKKDGKEFLGELSAVVIKDISGNPVSFVAITKDITDRKKAEEKLHKTITDLQRFNRLSVGRELQMIELKREVNDLLQSMGRQEKYEIPTSENVENKKGG
jgi:PAS domain S-box-containing protein